MSSSSQAGRARFREASRAAKLHAKASVIGQELTPRPLLIAEALSRRRCSDRRRWPPLFVGHGPRVAAAGSAAAPVAAAGAWAHDAGRGVHAGDVVALNATADADAGDEEAPVGRDVGAARGVDGD